MTAGALCLLTTALALAEPTKDQDLLQGNWKVASLESSGKKAEAKAFAGWNLVVEGDKMTARDGTEVMDESTFRLDPAAKPRAIDLKVVTGPDKGKAVRGIYRLEGDELSICVAEPEKDRPTVFRTAEGSGHTLLVFKRAKP
jgi:uncharacterized protein (TIGR03067 family)